jgi:hypothetical protein
MATRKTKPNPDLATFVPVAAPSPNSTLDFAAILAAFNAKMDAAAQIPTRDVILSFGTALPRAASDAELVSLKASEAFRAITLGRRNALVLALKAGPRADEADAVVTALKAETGEVKSPRSWVSLFGRAVDRVRLGDTPEAAIVELSKDPDLRPDPALVAATKDLISKRKQFRTALKVWSDALPVDGDYAAKVETINDMLAKLEAMLPQG